MLPSPNSLHHVTEQAESEESETKPDKKKLEEQQEQSRARANARTEPNRVKKRKKDLIAPEPLVPGTEAYKKRWDEAVQNNKTCKACQDKYIGVRTSLFNPNSDIPIPQPVPQPLNSYSLFQSCSTKFLDRNKKEEIFEWDEIKATNHPEYKIWLRRRETLLLEHQKQIQLGYIRLFTNEEKHAKKKKIKRELFEQEDLQTNFRGIQKTPTKNSLEQSRNDFVAPGPFFTKMEVSEGSSEETMDYRRKCEAFLDSLTGVRALSPNFTTNHDHTYCKLHNNSSGAHRTYFNVTSGLPRPGHNGSTYSMLHNSMPGAQRAYFNLNSGLPCPEHNAHTYNMLHSSIPGSYRSHLNLISSLPQHNDRTYRMLHNSMSGARGTHFHLKISSLPLPKPNMEPPTLHIMLESNTSNMLGETVHIMIDLPEPTKINGSSQLLNNAPESRPICPDEKVAQALPTEVKSNFLVSRFGNYSNCLAAELKSELRKLA
eukprot:NP_508312.1 Uncharacterized protein CELE_C36C9.5 [Caenorhabditis elegans]